MNGDGWRWMEMDGNEWRWMKMSKNEYRCVQVCIYHKKERYSKEREWKREGCCVRPLFSPSLT